MEFNIDPQMPQEQLDEIGAVLSEALAAELSMNPEEVRVEVHLSEDEKDADMISICYLVRVRGEAPSELEMYQACELFNRIMQVLDDEDPYALN